MTQFKCACIYIFIYDAYSVMCQSQDPEYIDGICKIDIFDFLTWISTTHSHTCKYLSSLFSHSLFFSAPLFSLFYFLCLYLSIYLSGDASVSDRVKSKST